MIVAAASRGKLHVINELLNSGAWIDEVDSQGHTALHTACFCGSQECAVFLVEKGANVNVVSKKGCGALAWAAFKGHIKTVKALIEHKADVNGDNGVGTVVSPSEIPTIPLHAAAKADKLDCLCLLLDKKADIEKKNQKGERALHIAAMSDSLVCVRELLIRGADFGAVDNEFKAVVEKASDAGSVESMEYLIKWEQYQGEPPAEEKNTVEETKKWEPDFSKISPLYFKLNSWMGESAALVNAAKKGEFSVCRGLLEQGADPNCAMKQSPIAAAAANGHLNIVILLLQSGADPNRESGKRLPADYAKENGFDEVVELLKHPYICASCAKKVDAQKDLKRCGKCKIVKYCSQECQKKHWTKFHRRQCTIWEQRKDELNNRDKKSKK